MIVIHAKFASGPAWHKRYANALVDGFKEHGVTPHVTEADDVRDAHDYGNVVHVIFGPNYFPKVFAKACKSGNALTINRCFYGDHNDNVAIGWNGFNGLAEFPGPIDGRLDQELHKLPEKDVYPQKNGCGLIIGEYVSPCDDKRAINEFYKNSIQDCLDSGLSPVFRPHPLQKHKVPGTVFSTNADIRAAQIVFTYASTYGVHARLIGCPVWADNASLAHADGEETERQWLERVVAAQWHITEIESGRFWEHLSYA